MSNNVKTVDMWEQLDLTKTFQCLEWDPKTQVSKEAAVKCRAEMRNFKPSFPSVDIEMRDL